MCRDYEQSNVARRSVGRRIDSSSILPRNWVRNGIAVSGGPGSSYVKAQPRDWI